MKKEVKDLLYSLKNSDICTLKLTMKDFIAFLT